MNQCNQTSRLTIGISTVRRQSLADDPGYLSKTVNGLLASMSAAERARVEIVIINSNSPPEAHTEVEQLLARHAECVPHLLRSAARAAPSFQPDDASDRARKVAWEKKLSLDFVEALRICRNTDSKYVLRLEDDVMAADHFVTHLMQWCERQDTADKPWAFLSLFSADLGPPHRLWPYCAYSQAILFPNDERLDDIIRYIEEHYHRAPVDFLLAEYRDPAGRRGWVKYPSLFQHIGDLSTGLAEPPRTSPTFCPSCHPLHLALQQTIVMLKYLPLGMKLWLQKS
jgi:hypothetical protein